MPILTAMTAAAGPQSRQVKRSRETSLAHELCSAGRSPRLRPERVYHQLYYRYLKYNVYIILLCCDDFHEGVPGDMHVIFGA